MMKKIIKIFRFLIIRSEIWFRLIILIMVIEWSVKYGVFIFWFTFIIGSSWLINGWRLSLTAYGEKYKELIK